VVSDPKGTKDDEIERLRSILRDVHKPQGSFARDLMDGVKQLLGARIQKKAIADRIEKPVKDDAA
jgi:hypothetical protein